MNEFFLRNRMHDYLDKELSTEDAREFELAIQEHPSLIQELKELQEMRELFLDDDISAPEHFQTELLEKVAELPLPVHKVLPANRNLYWVSGLLASAIVLWMIVPSSSNNPNILAQEIEASADSAQSIPLINTLNLPRKPLIIEEDSAEENDLLEEPSMENSEIVANFTPQVQQSKNIVFEIQAPEDPYVADWEDDDNQVDNQIIVVGQAQKNAQNEAYQFAAAPASALWVLHSIATDYGGRILHGNRQPLQPYNLTTEQSFQKLFIEIPDHRIDELDNQLRQIGGKYTGPKIQSEGHLAYFPIEVLYQLH